MSFKCFLCDKTVPHVHKEASFEKKMVTFCLVGSFVLLFLLFLENPWYLIWLVLNYPIVGLALIMTITMIPLLLVLRGVVDKATGDK